MKILAYYFYHFQNQDLSIQGSSRNSPVKEKYHDISWWKKLGSLIKKIIKITDVKMQWDFHYYFAHGYFNKNASLIINFMYLSGNQN